MVRYLTGVVVPRAHAAALALALAFAAGVAIAAVIALATLGVGDIARIGRPANGVVEVRAPGGGLRAGDLTTVDPTWRHIACPPGRQPGAGGEISLTCVAETTR